MSSKMFVWYLNQFDAVWIIWIFWLWCSTFIYIIIYLSCWIYQYHYRRICMNIHMFFEGVFVIVCVLFCFQIAKVWESWMLRAHMLDWDLAGMTSRGHAQWNAEQGLEVQTSDPWGAFMIMISSSFEMSWSSLEKDRSRKLLPLLFTFVSMLHLNILALSCGEGCRPTKRSQQWNLDHIRPIWEVMNMCYCMCFLYYENASYTIYYIMFSSQRRQKVWSRLTCKHHEFQIVRKKEWCFLHTTFHTREACRIEILTTPSITSLGWDMSASACVTLMSWET